MGSFKVQLNDLFEIGHGFTNLLKFLKSTHIQRNPLPDRYPPILNNMVGTPFVRVWSSWKQRKLQHMGTLPKTSITPENMPFQKVRSVPTINFQVRTVSFLECNPFFLIFFCWEAPALAIPHRLPVE